MTTIFFFSDKDVIGIAGHERYLSEDMEYGHWRRAGLTKARSHRFSGIRLPTKSQIAMLRTAVWVGLELQAKIRIATIVHRQWQNILEGATRGVFEVVMYHRRFYAKGGVQEIARKRDENQTAELPERDKGSSRQSSCGKAIGLLIVQTRNMELSVWLVARKWCGTHKM
jgi:hypothetical protein